MLEDTSGTLPQEFPPPRAIALYRGYRNITTVESNVNVVEGKQQG